MSTDRSPFNLHLSFCSLIGCLIISTRVPRDFSSARTIDSLLGNRHFVVQFIWLSSLFVNFECFVIIVIFCEYRFCYLLLIIAQ